MVLELAAAASRHPVTERRPISIDINKLVTKVYAIMYHMMNHHMAFGQAPKTVKLKLLLSSRERDFPRRSRRERRSTRPL